MAEELDLSNPLHLADLLGGCLPGFEHTTPEEVEPHIEALAKSDNDLFAGIGVGERVPDPNQVVEQEPPQEQQEQQEQAEQQEQDEQQPPEEELPLDLGGEGDQIQQVVTESGVPVIARRGWTEIDRHRSKGEHPVYKLEARHHRMEPITSEFTGQCQSVRVQLPRIKASDEAFIGTFIGTVEAKDHLAFSIDEVARLYHGAFGRWLALERVDLITGARFRGRRFSPVSVYLGYEDAQGAPSFYFLEGGSAKGEPEALYCAPDLESNILAQSNFSFTPFSCKANWYDGGFALDHAKREPACVYLSSAQERDGDHEYIKLSVTYELDEELRRVIHPFELQIEAALRVLAIAQQMGCRLKPRQGGGLEYGIGPLARALLRWDQRPDGDTNSDERSRYCGCPK